MNEREERTWRCQSVKKGKRIFPSKYTSVGSVAVELQQGSEEVKLFGKGSLIWEQVLNPRRMVMGYPTRGWSRRGNTNVLAEGTGHRYIRLLLNGC